jgi:hypothetical protein
VISPTRKKMLLFGRRLQFSFIGGINSGNAVDMGAEHTRRYIIVAHSWAHTTDPFTATHVFLGAPDFFPMTLAAMSPSSGSSLAVASIWIGLWPTGATGSIFATTSGFNRSTRVVYRAVNLRSPIPFATASTDSSGAGASIAIPKGGFAIVCGARQNATPFTLTNVTNDYAASDTSLHYSANGSVTSALGGTVVSDATISDAGLKIAAASFR